MKAGNRAPKPVEGSSADTRTLILDATEQIMLSEGYAGVSSRKVAARAGLKSNLLHYYFKNMDDLFIAAFHRLEERYDIQMAKASVSATPLRDLWSLGREPTTARLVLEFTALASHKPAVREVIGRSARRDRRIMTAALTAIFERYGVDCAAYPPKVIALMMAGLTRAISTETVLGSDEGHVEAMDFVEHLVDSIEPMPPAKRPA